VEDNDAQVISLFGTDVESPAFKRWADRIGAYLDEREIVEEARHRAMPDPPWPAEGNAMLGYLVDRAKEIFDAEGMDSALVWLVVHGWFEGALDEKYRSVQSTLGRFH
jgi:hypothetical protein